MHVRVSHVGSFPFKPEAQSVELVVKGYVESGVNAPAYPQLRDFVRMFLEPYIEAGILDDVGGMYLVKDMEGLKKPPELKPEIWEAELFVEASKGVFKYLRAPVTGAFTLAINILLQPKAEYFSATALCDKQVVESLAAYVKNNLKYLASLGYNILFVDEPMLSVVVGARKVLLGYALEDIADYLDYVYSGVTGERGIHVCGRISKPLFRTLVSVEELDVVNFEFYGTRENVQVLERELLEAHSKKLAPGIASSKSMKVEPVEELLGILKEIVNRAGLNVDLVSADDGFRGLRDVAPETELREICFNKLKRIREAVDRLVAGLKDPQSSDQRYESAGGGI
ncbi:MAG: methionine synthase [Desulfurococcaceae archaeon]